LCWYCIVPTPRCSCCRPYHIPQGLPPSPALSLALAVHNPYGHCTPSPAREDSKVSYPRAFRAPSSALFLLLVAGGSVCGVAWAWTWPVLSVVLKGRDGGGWDLVGGSRVIAQPPPPAPVSLHAIPHSSEAFTTALREGCPTPRAHSRW
jgi:DNA-binding transcriptional LysR family regulator